MIRNTLTVILLLIPVVAFGFGDINDPNTFHISSQIGVDVALDDLVLRTGSEGSETQPFRTIQFALDQASPINTTRSSDSIFIVHEGVYNEIISLQSKHSRMQLLARGNVIIDAEQGGAQGVIFCNSNPGVNRFVIDGFEIINGDAFGISLNLLGIQVIDSVIRNNIIHNMLGQNSGGIEILSNNTHFLKIENNLIYDITGPSTSSSYGIKVGFDGLNASINDNTILNWKSKGINFNITTSWDETNIFNNIFAFQFSGSALNTSIGNYNVFFNAGQLPVGLNDLEVDPQFSDSSSAIFTLRKTSPIIGLGKPIGSQPTTPGAFGIGLIAASPAQTILSGDSILVDENGETWIDNLTGSVIYGPLAGAPTPDVNARVFLDPADSKVKLVSGKDSGVILSPWIRADSNIIFNRIFYNHTPQVLGQQISTIDDDISLPRTIKWRGSSTKHTIFFDTPGLIISFDTTSSRGLIVNPNFEYFQVRIKFRKFTK